MTVTVAVALLVPPAPVALNVYAVVEPGVTLTLPAEMLVRSAVVPRYVLRNPRTRMRADASFSSAEVWLVTGAATFMAVSGVRPAPWRERHSARARGSRNPR